MGFQPLKGGGEIPIGIARQRGEMGSSEETLKLQLREAGGSLGEGFLCQVIQFVTFLSPGWRSLNL